MSLGSETQIQYNKLSNYNFLSKNPVSDVFQKMDYQSEDFASFSDTITHSNAPDYNNIVNFTIPKSQGDALRNLCLLINLNPLLKTSGTYACYTNTIGYALFEYIELTVGEISIFKKYREECDYDFYFDMDKQFSASNVVDESQNMMIGKYSNLMQLKNNAINKSNLIVPITSFIDAATWKSLFLFYLQHQDIQVKIKLAPFSDVVNYDGTTPPLQNEFGNIQLYGTFYKMSKETKDRLLQNITLMKPMWKILNSQYTTVSGASKVTIPFSGDTTHLTIACRTLDRKNNNDFFNYSFNGQPIISELGLKIDNIDLILPTNEFTIRNYNNYYKLYPSSKYIYTIPFAENIKKWTEYSGSLNLRETKHLDLNIKLNDGLTFEDIEIVLFTKRFNWIIPQDRKISIQFLD